MKRKIDAPHLFAFWASVAFILAVGAFASSPGGLRHLHGLPIEPEQPCPTYDPAQFSYPPSIESKIVLAQGGVFSPYTDECFASTADTDIEHIVARAESARSGMCGRPAADKKAFARDLLNLTLASPRVNRAEKSDKDLGAWLPKKNICWTANRVVEVKRKWGLAVDAREAAALARIYKRCRSFALERPACITGD